MKKSTIIALVIFGVLVAVYLGLRDTPETSVPTPYSIAAVEGLSQIEVSRADGESGEIVLEKGPDTWTMTQPVESPLDEKVVESINEVFSSRIATDDLGLSEDKLAEYELDDDGGVDVALFSAGSEPDATFRVGKEMTVEATRARRSFIRADDGAIYRARKSLEFLRKPASELRSRLIFSADRAGFESISIKRGDETLLLKKDSEADSWSLSESPVELERASVTGLVSTLSNLKATGFADGVTEAEVGLDEPDAVITTKPGEETLNLSVSLHEGTYYVKKHKSDFIYEVAEHVGKRLNATLNDLRSKTPVKIEKESIRSVQFAGDDKVALRKSGDEWQMTAPQRKTLADSAVASHIGAVASLRVVRFEDTEPAEAGLTGGDRVVVETEGGRRTLLVGDEIDPDRGERFAMWQDDELVFVISKSQYSRLTPSADDLGE